MPVIGRGAGIISTGSDAAGAEEEPGKGDLPKSAEGCIPGSGRTVKSRATVINRWSAT